jgi:DNA-directed RNA polymerase subunit RPC12/RpoP
MSQLWLEKHENCTPLELETWFKKVQGITSNTPYGAGKQVFVEKPNRITILNTEFENEQAASFWISDNNKRMDPVVAVRFKEQIDLTPAELGPEYEVLMKKAMALFEQVQGFAHLVIRAEAAKSKKKTITCSGCGSKFDLATYLAKTPQLMTDCPLCRTNILFKPAHTKAKERLVEQHKKALKAMEDVRTKRRIQLKKDKPKIQWLVGGWCGERECEC